MSNIPPAPQSEAELRALQARVRKSIAGQFGGFRPLRMIRRADIVGLWLLVTYALTLIWRWIVSFLPAGAFHRATRVSRIGTAIIMPTKNRTQMMQRALLSLSSQTVLPTEIVIANDGDEFSQADVAAIRSAIDPRITLTIIKAAGKGSAMARSQAIAATSAPIVAYLDDDNLMAAGWIARVERFYATGATAILYGAQLRPGSDRGLLEGRFSLEMLKLNNYIDSNTIVHNREVGVWDGSFRRLNDWDMILTAVLQKNVPVKRVVSVASIYLLDAPNRISSTEGDYDEWAGKIRAKHGI
jgi:glycosyltransferase involved in cell wall biosynthesis